VLDAAGDAPAPRPAEGAADRRHQPEGDAQLPAGVGDREHRGADAGGAVVGPGDGGGAAGVDRDHRQVGVHVDAGDAADHAAAVGEHHRGLLAAEVVGVGGDPAVGQHHPGAAAAAAADADHRGPDPLGHLGDGLLQLVEDAHGGPSRLASNL
jgi:hypothetical protein